MKIIRFNESTTSDVVYYKRYRGDIEECIKKLEIDVNYIITKGIFLYDIYYSDKHSVVFSLYVYVDDISLVNNYFFKSNMYKNMHEIRNAMEYATNYKKINKEDFESIYLSIATNKFNL